MIGRRGFLRGAGLLLAAPAIVRASSLMPVRVMPAGDLLTLDIVRRANAWLKQQAVEPWRPEYGWLYVNERFLARIETADTFIDAFG